MTASHIAVLFVGIAGGFLVGLVIGWARRTGGGPGVPAPPFVRAELDRLHDAVVSLTREQARSGGEVADAMRRLQGTADGLGIETRALRSALGDVRVRGSWGEIHLQRVVELAGMVEHCDFSTQNVVSGENGRRRPDLIVWLPGGRAVVVDAKTPLDSFLASAEAGDPATVAEHRRRHAVAVRQHARVLAARNYPEAVDGAIDLVVMFVPGEAFVAAACSDDPKLLDDMLDAGVVIATPTTLVALLRSFALGWREHRLADNAAAIADLGSQVYERAHIFAEHLGAVGASLRTTVDRYNLAVGSLDSRLVPSLRRLAEHGAGTSRREMSLSTLDASVRAPDDRHGPRA